MRRKGKTNATPLTDSNETMHHNTRNEDMRRIGSFLEAIRYKNPRMFRQRSNQIIAI